MKVVHTNEAPAAIGPYSQAMEVGNLILASGQIPLIPETMEVIEGGIVEQTDQVMKNVTNLLKACGVTLNEVAKTTCYLRNMEDFPQFNEVYAKYFGDHKPARSTVAVRELPKNVLCEVEVIAVKK